MNPQCLGRILVVAGCLQRVGHFFPTVKVTPPLEVENGSYLSEVLTEKAIEFLEENRNHPFLLFLSHFAVHIPLEARGDLIRKYQSAAKSPGGINNPIYAAMVEHVDRSVGRIVERLGHVARHDCGLLLR